MIKELNDSDFNQSVVESKGTAVVDFWAEWCGPCQAMGPILASVAEISKDKAQFFKLNVDKNQEIASRFGVMSIPTLVFFVDGKEVERRVGLQSEDSIMETLDGITKN